MRGNGLEIGSGAGTPIAQPHPLWDRVCAAYLMLSRIAILSVATAMFVLMVGVNAYNIAARTFFNSDLSWSQEMSIMAAMWVYFAAYALIAKEDAYVRIDFFVAAMPRPLARVVHLLSRVATTVFQASLLIFTWWALKVVAVFQTNVLEWPEYFFYVPLLVASADIVVTEIIHLARTLAGRPLGAAAATPLIGTGS